MDIIKIKSLDDEKAGFVYDVSQIIIKEIIKNPSLIPDLSKERTIFVFSDYSKVRGKYKTYSYLIIGRSSADYFNGARKHLREDFNLSNRRMSYKTLNDKIKLKALPAFLSLAGAMKGILVTFAVDTRIKYMFAEQFLEGGDNPFPIKKNTLEETLRITHFGSQAIMNAFSSKQNIVWFTDSDAIVANEDHEIAFGKLAETLIRKMFMPNENIGKIGFGVSEVDNGSLEIEDFISIPDLVSGAICETLDRCRENDLRVATKIMINMPKVSRKTNLICDWLGKIYCPLQKFGVVFDKVGNGKWDFRPTFFRIENPNISDCEINCKIQEKDMDIYDPIHFDIEDYILK